MSGIFNQPNLDGPSNARNQLEEIEWLERIEAAIRLQNALGGGGSPGGGGTALKAKLGFAFGDASQRLLYSVATGDLITRVMVILLTPFDSPSATLSVGDAENQQRLLPNSAIALAESATWISHPNYQYASASDINIYLSPEGATQGQGVVYLYSD